MTYLHVKLETLSDYWLIYQRWCNYLYRCVWGTGQGIPAKYAQEVVKSRTHQPHLPVLVPYSLPQVSHPPSIPLLVSSFLFFLRWIYLAQSLTWFLPFLGSIVLPHSLSLFLLFFSSSGELFSLNPSPGSFLSSLPQVSCPPEFLLVIPLPSLSSSCEVPMESHCRFV